MKLTLLIGLGVVVAIALGLYAVAEVGQEVVVLHRWNPAGAADLTRLWIVDQDDQSWIHHGTADAAWVARLADDPVVSLERAGAQRRYRATPDPDSHALVHRLVGEKYGRFARAMSTPAESCEVLPVRLDATKD